MNKRLNKFSFYSAKYWKGNIKSRLNDIFIVLISFLFFLIYFPFRFFVLISILFVSFKRYNKSIKRDIFCFDFRSNFLVSASFLINIGKKMSLPGFRRNYFTKFVISIKLIKHVYFISKTSFQVLSGHFNS